MARDYVQNVAESLIEQLRQGTAPWVKPWAPGEHFMPYNPTSGNEYHGMNAVWLMSVAEARGYDDARWMTYRQAAGADAQVRKGEKGTLIQYWKWQELQPLKDEHGQPVLDENGQPRTQLVRFERPRVWSAVVFNAAQIERLAPSIARTAPPEWERQQAAETILAASGAAIVHQRGDRAFYSLGQDRITLPERDQFASADRYYATALHELGHWTGHPTRLARDMAHPFGSEGYAKEELRAEIASLMLGEQLGIGHDPGQHAAYVKSWIKVLEEDPREIFRAASDAEKIVKHVRAYQLQQPAEITPDAPVVGPEIEPVRSPILVSDETEAAMRTNSERVYLAVPYAEKDAAKALGARWDRAEKSWYVPAGTDLGAFQRWAPGVADLHLFAHTADPREEFAAALRESGLRIEGLPAMDGQLRRVPVDGDHAGDRSGAYVGYLDGHPAGFIQNFKTGLRTNWKSGQRQSSLNAQDRARLAAEAAERRQARVLEREKEYEVAAAAVAAHLATAVPATEHPYLTAKVVQAHGVLVDVAGNLLVPVRDIDGKLLSAQTIDAEGRKSFARGTRVTGGHHVIGEISDDKPILIAEGYATAATLHEATGLPVAVAFNAGNLEPVARAFRERYPEAQLVIAGDNDHARERELGPDGHPKRNVGRIAAELAAASVNGAVLLPRFTAWETGSDWSDFARHSGPDELRSQLKTGLARGRVFCRPVPDNGTAHLNRPTRSVLWLPRRLPS